MKSTFSKTFEFLDLESRAQNTVAKIIKDRNSLKINISNFKEKILENNLLVKFHKDEIQHFVSIGLKNPSDNLIHQILKSSGNLHTSKSNKLKLFLKNLEDGKCLERGWATNSSGVHAAIHLLDEDFKKLVKMKQKKMDHIFTLVVSTNTRGQSNTEKAGFQSVGLIQSPYSDNLLSLNIFFG